MSQILNYILLPIAVILPPLCVFAVYETVYSNLFITPVLDPKLAFRKINICTILSGFSKLHSFMSIKLIGLAVGINAGAVFYSWLDERMNFVMRTPGLVGRFFIDKTGLPLFLFFFLFVVLELILIFQMIFRCKKMHDAELRDTAGLILASARIPDPRKGKIRPFDEMIEDLVKAAREGIRHYERSSATMIGFLILGIAVVVVFL